MGYNFPLCPGRYLCLARFFISLRSFFYFDEKFDVYSFRSFFFLPVGDVVVETKKVMHQTEAV